MASHNDQYDTVEPVFLTPAEREVDPYLYYDETADTLILNLYGPIGPAINEPLRGGLMYLRIEPETHVAVGLQIEAFVHTFLQQRPEFLDLLRSAEGIDTETFERIRNDLDSNYPERIAKRLFESTTDSSLTIA